MAANMKVIGRKANIMEKECIKLLTELNMMESGLLESIMDLVHLYGLMEVYIKENGRTAEKQGKESFKESMEPFMKGNGKMENIMVKES